MSTILHTLARHNGYCPCCRSGVTFTVHGNWLRDDYRCDRCGSIPRQRHLVTILDLLFPKWRRMRIHESSPSPPSLSVGCRHYGSSQYLAGVRPGTSQKGIRCENLEALTFASDTFDIFITQDVMEHVFHPAKALQEIHRTLKSGGAHVFTAPKHADLAVSRCRARISPAGDVEHLMPEEYHGNPIGDGRALVTWDYGSDFERLASEWVGTSVTTYNTVDRQRGLDAAFNEVFVIVKP